MPVPHCQVGKIVEQSCHYEEAVRFIFNISSVGEVVHERRTELDSHADTCVTGDNFLKLSDDGQSGSNSSFNDKTQWRVPIATAATLYTSEKGDKYILIVHQSLYFGKKLKGSLLNPNQL